MIEMVEKLTAEQDLCKMLDKHIQIFFKQCTDATPDFLVTTFLNFNETSPSACAIRLRYKKFKLTKQISIGEIAELKNTAVLNYLYAFCSDMFYELFNIIRKQKEEENKNE